MTIFILNQFPTNVFKLYSSCLRIADNLPVATRLEFYPNREAGGEEEQKKDVVKDIQFEHGYRLGFVDNNKVTFLIILTEC